MLKELFKKKKSPIKTNKSTPGLIKEEKSRRMVKGSNSSEGPNDLKEHGYGPDYLI